MNKEEAQQLKRKALNLLKATNDRLRDEFNEDIIDAEIVDDSCLSRTEPVEVRAMRLPVPLKPFEPQKNPRFGKRRCTAHKKDGSRCSKPALAGLNVCRSHGGANKVSMMAAKRRLQEAADPVAAQLIRLSLEAESEQVSLGASNSVLDRTIGKAPTQIEVGIESKPWEQVYEGINNGVSRAESRAARGFIDEPLPEGFGINTPAAPCTNDDDEWLSDQFSETLEGGHRKYHVNHIVGEDAVRIANRLRFGQIER